MLNASFFSRLDMISDSLKAGVWSTGVEPPPNPQTPKTTTTEPAPLQVFYAPPFLALDKWLWVKKPMGSHVGVGEFTTHFRTYFSGWIGMFTGGTIWILQSPWPCGNRAMETTPQTPKSIELANPPWYVFFTLPPFQTRALQIPLRPNPPLARQAMLSDTFQVSFRHIGGVKRAKEAQPSLRLCW